MKTGKPRLPSVRWRLWIGAAGGLVVLMLLGGLLVLQTDWFQQKVLERILREAQRATGGRVEIAEFDFDPFGLRVSMKGLKLYAAKPEIPPFLSVPSVELRLGITSLLRREVWLRSMRVESPEITVELGEDGSSNLPGFARMRTTGEAPGEEFINLAIGRLDLRRGSLYWGGTRYPFSFAGDQFQLRTRFEPIQDRYRTWVRLGDSRFDDGQKPPLISEAEAEFFLYRDRLEAPDLYLAGNELQVFGGLKASSLEQPEVHGNYRVQFGLSPWSQWLGLSAATAGEGRVEGNAEWQSASGELRYDGRMDVSGLTLETARWALPPIGLRGRYQGDRRRLAVRDLEVAALRGMFSGEAVITDLDDGGRFQVEGDFDGFRLASLLRIPRSGGSTLKQIPWDSHLSGWLQASGSGAADARAALSLILAEPSPVGSGTVPLAGVVNASYDAETGVVELPRMELRTPYSRLSAQGTMTSQARAALELEAIMEDPRDLLGLAEVFGGDPKEVPLTPGGALRFQGSLNGNLLASPPEVHLTGQVRADKLRVRGYEWQLIEGEVDVSPDHFELTQGRIQDSAGSADVELYADLQDGRPAPDGALRGEVRLLDLSLEQMLASAGRQEPITGTLRGDVRFEGTTSQPTGTGRVEVTKGAAWGQPFGELQARFRFDDQVMSLESLELRQGQARVLAKAALQTEDQRFQFDLRANNWRLEDLQLATAQERKPAGELLFEVSGSGRLASGESRLEDLAIEGSLGLAGLTLGDKRLGTISADIAGSDDQVELKWRASLFEGVAAGTVAVQPRRDLPFSGELEWNRFAVQTLAEFVDVPLRQVSGEIDGKGSFEGQLLHLEDLSATGEVTRLEMTYSEVPGADSGYGLWNPFPMRWSVAEKKLLVDQVRVLGDGTDVVVDGSVDLAEPREVNLSTQGTFNLAVLESFRPNLTARGSSTLEVRLRGRLDDPSIRGRVQLKNASLRHTDFSNGLSQLSGELRFSDRLVRIENLTASSRGGSLRLQGTTEFSEDRWIYRLEAQAERVRLRYPESVSNVVDGKFTLSGSDVRSLLSGEVVVRRVTLGPQVEIGVIQASLSEPTPTPASNPVLLNMQLDVRISSAPGLPIETTLIRNVAADFDLRLTGTAVSPSLLGRVSITQGQLDFSGSRFEINRGDIDFVNPFRIDPVIDFELEARIGAYDIALTVSGPARRPNLTPRSDPPLPFNQIVTLIAVGRSPTTDPVLAAQQTLEQQSLIQTGANTVLAQALSQPVNRRLERFFGVSRIKVDPQIGGAEANPSARISTEQQITNQLTLTYSYDLSSSQQQVVSIEYTPTRQWSIIVVRDENGLVGADVLLRKRFR